MDDQANKHGSWQTGAFALVAAVLIAYSPALIAGWVFDDTLITRNPNLQDWAGLVRCWTDPKANEDFYPVTFTSWWIDYQFWGLRPLGYHVGNLLLHLGNVLLLFAILRRLAVCWPLFVAMVFAIHPVQVESVVWAVQRKNTLSGLFFLLSAWLFVTFWLARNEPSEPEDKARRGDAAWWRYGASLAAFVLAMLAKPLTMTLAAGIAIFMWWRRGGRVVARDLALAAPYFTLLLPMAALTIWVQKTHVGAAGHEFSLTMADRVLIAGRALCFYASKILAPVGICFSYSRWDVRADAWWQWAFPLIAAISLAAAWMLRRRIGAGLFASLLFFVAMLSPALGFVDVYWFRYYFVVDHMQYMAIIGIALPVAFALSTLLDRQPPGGRGKLKVAIVAAVLSLIGLTFWQGLAYADEKTLWADVLAKNERAFLAHNNLGVLALREGDEETALGHLRRAVELLPTADETLKPLIALLVKRGEFAEAADAIARRLKAGPADVGLRLYRGELLAKAGQREASREAFRDALESIDVPASDARPDATSRSRADARLQRAVALAGAGRGEEALPLFDQAADLAPDHPTLHFQKAQVLLGLERIPEAIVALRVQASRDPPADVEAASWHASVLALALSVSKDETVRDLIQARQLATFAVTATQNRSPRCLEALALVLAAQGDRAQADRLFAAAIDLSRSAGFANLVARATARRARLARGEVPTLSGQEIAFH